MKDVHQRWLLRPGWKPGAVLALFAILGVYLMFTSHMASFDTEQWKAQRGLGDRDNPRVDMVVGLQRQHLRQGMSREEVRKLLGEPDQQQEHREVYELGRSPVGVSFESLVIDYDSSGRVTRSSISRS